MVRWLDGFRLLVVRHSERFFLAWAVILALAVGTLDYCMGHQLRFAPLYLPSVFLIGWFSDFRKGLWMCVGITLVWFSAHVLAGPRYEELYVYGWNFSVRFLSYVVFFLIIAHLRQEKRYALTDVLTGVANRRALIDFASREIERAQRNRTPLSLAFLDCDDFKQVNDRWGHQTGDSLLIYLAKTITTNIRSTDMVARVGGDEFALLLPETAPDEAKKICLGIKRVLEEGCKLASCPATISMGVVTFRDPPPHVDDLLRPADQLMYQVKRSGKNGVEFLSVGSGGAIITHENQVTA